MQFTDLFKFWPTRVPVNIGIIDEQAIFRKGISLMLSGSKKVNTVAEAGSPSAYRMGPGTGTEPEIIIMDAGTYERDENAGPGALSGIHPDAKFLIIYLDISVEQVTGLIKKGARGFLSKADDPDEFRRALLNIRRNGYHYNQLLTNRIVDQINNDKDPDDKQWERNINQNSANYKNQMQKLREDGYLDIVKQFLEIEKRGW